MHVLWLSEQQEDNREVALVNRLHNQGHIVTLGYTSLHAINLDLFRSVNAAFPWVAPEFQLPQIDPDVVVIWVCHSAWKSLDWSALQIPTLFIHASEMDEASGKLFPFLESQSPRPRKPFGSTSFSVSVVMRSRNDADVIRQTLKALFSQTVKMPHILLVDSGSTDGTREIVKEFPVDLITIAPNDYYPGRVLNRAMTLTKGDSVVFLNSDAVLLTPLSLELLLRRLEDPNAAAVYARQYPRSDAEVWVKRDYAAAFPADEQAPPWMSLSLCFAAIKRQLWQQHPFYTKAWGSEDAEWGYWARSEGLDIAYVPNSLCMHSHNYSLKQLYGRRYIEGEADAFILHRTYTWDRFLRDVFASSAKDIVAYCKASAYLSLLSIPFRRFIYHWGYFRGNAWGNYRRRAGIDDVKTGQQKVLKHYDS